MSDTHTPINEEVEVMLKLKVKLTQASYCGERTQDELNAEIVQAKSNLKERLLEIVVDEYCAQKLSDGKLGYVNFDYEVLSAE